MTTNGKLIQKVPLDTFKDVTMISISYDDEKIKDINDALSFSENISYLKDNFPKIKIGVNYLCNNKGLRELKDFTKFFFEVEKIDRVFALCPKNFKAEILKYRNQYIYLTKKYPNFMVDDLTKCIIEAGKYKEWKRPCHFGKIVSIDEEGNVGGCSFDLGKVECLKLKRASDIMLINDITFIPRYKCPYLIS